MMARLIFIGLACVTGLTSGFTIVARSNLHKRPHLVVKSKQWLNDIDEMCLENAADYCLDDEQCDIEIKLALINQLQDQRDLMAEKAQGLDSLIVRLKSSKVNFTVKDKERIDTLMKSVDGSLSV